MTVSPATETPASDRRRRPGRSGRLTARDLQGALYASPTLVFVLFLFVVPLGLVLYMSTNKWSLLGGKQGSNFPANFQQALEHPMFWPAVSFTAKYTVIATVLLIGLGLCLALLVQESSRWKGFLRTTVLVPSALGLASASLIFYALYSPQVGPVPRWMQALGVTDAVVSPLGTPDGALWATVFLIVWRFAGFYMLLLLVGLQAISRDVYEAARIDGAGTLAIFRRITLPLLRPSLALSTVMCVTGSLLAFDQFFILTKGGPDGSTMTIVQLIYNVAFETKRDLGIAAALSVIVLVALVVINVFQLRVLRGSDEK